MLLRNWHQRNSVYDAGHVYATMIAYGNNPSGNNAVSNNIGAGRLVMGAGGVIAFGRSTVTNGKNVDISISVAASSRKNVDVAIWRPETVATHNNINLDLVSPSGALLRSSYTTNGVWEKLSYDSTSFLPGGTYKLRMKGSSVGAAGQVVYYAFYQQ